PHGRRGFRRGSDFLQQDSSHRTRHWNDKFLMDRLRDANADSSLETIAPQLIAVDLDLQRSHGVGALHPFAHKGWIVWNRLADLDRLIFVVANQNDARWERLSPRSG